MNIRPCVCHIRRIYTYTCIQSVHAGRTGNTARRHVNAKTPEICADADKMQIDIHRRTPRHTDTDIQTQTHRHIHTGTDT